MTTTLRRLAVAGPTLLTTGLLLLVTVPAEAAGTGLKLCAKDDYKGQCETRQHYDKDFGNDPCGISSCGVFGSSFEDAASSYVNYTDDWWKMYSDKNWRGFVLCVRPHGHDRDLGDNTDYEDDISSVQRMGGSRPTGCDQVIG